MIIKKDSSLFSFFFMMVQLSSGLEFQVLLSLLVLLIGLIQVLEHVADPCLRCGLPFLPLSLLFLGQRLRKSSLGCQRFLSLLPAFLIGFFRCLLHNNGVGVQNFEGLLVLEWVLLLNLVEGSVLVCGSHHALDRVGVDDPGEVGVAEDGSVELVALFLFSLLPVRAEDVIQGLECARGPDDEPAELAARSQLSEVEPVHVADLHSRDVPECLDQLHVLVGVDHKGSLSELVPSASHFSLAGSQSLVLHDLEDVLVGAEPLEEGHCVLGLLIALELVVDDEGELRDVLDSVASGKDEREQGRSGQGSSRCVSSLLEVHFSVPEKVEKVIRVAP